MRGELPEVLAERWTGTEVNRIKGNIILYSISQAINCRGKQPPQTMQNSCQRYIMAPIYPQ
jgi:hypothetical protein